MWKFLTFLPIKAKIFAILVFIFVIFFGLIFIGVYWENKNRVLRSADDRMYAHLQDLEDIFSLHKSNKEFHIKQGLKWGQSILQDAGEIKEIPTKRLITNVIDTENEKVVRAELTEWTLNNKSFQFDTTLVDKIAKNTQCEVTILQNIPQGLVRIATTIRNANNQRIIRTFIGNKSPVYQNINKNQTYQGRIKIKGEWFLAYYYPLYAKGKLIGALGITIPEKDLKALKSIMNKHNYLQSGFAYVMDKEGNVLIHKSKAFEGNNFKKINPKFYNWAINIKTKEKMRYLVPAPVFAWRWQYLKYYEPYNMYIAIVVPEKEIFDDILNSLAQLMFFAFLVTVVGGIFLINLLVNPIFKPLENIDKTLNDMSFGKPVQSLKIVFFDEVGKIAHSLNQVIHALKTYSIFAQEVGKKNFNADFKPLSNDDVLGNNLLEMADKLEGNESEIKKRTWIAEGNALLGSIMRKNAGNLPMLMNQTLKTLLDYVNAQQGGIFLLEKDATKGDSLNLVACYAYQRERILNKKVDIQTGFLGQCVQSKKTIFVENLPKNYSELITGTEKILPHSLIAIPLKIQEEIAGVIEILTFKQFSQYEIIFLENFAETLSATIIVEQSNHAMRMFLQQMQETAEMLAQQDEEMRQNMEELRAMQEVSQNKEYEIQKLLIQSNEKEKTLQDTIEEMKKMEVQMYIQRTTLEKELDQARTREKELLVELTILKNK